MMQRAEIIGYCQREAARLRSVLLRTTTPAIRERLGTRIEEFERIAKGKGAEPAELELAIAQSRW